MRVPNRVEPNRTYDETFKQDALALLRRSDRSIKALAESLGVPNATLRYWYKADMAKKGRKSASVVKPPERDQRDETQEEKIARLEKENAALRKKNEQLETDRAILRKAAAFFAKESE